MLVPGTATAAPRLIHLTSLPRGDRAFLLFLCAFFALPFALRAFESGAWRTKLAFGSFARPSSGTRAQASGCRFLNPDRRSTAAVLRVETEAVFGVLSSFPSTSPHFCHPLDNRRHAYIYCGPLQSPAHDLFWHENGLRFQAPECRNKSTRRLTQGRARAGSCSISHSRHQFATSHRKPVGLFQTQNILSNC